MCSTHNQNKISAPLVMTSQNTNSSQIYTIQAGLYPGQFQIGSSISFLVAGFVRKTQFLIVMLLTAMMSLNVPIFLRLCEEDRNGKILYKQGQRRN
jgi:hypothetical protein